MAHALFMSEWSRRYTHTTVAFLTTRVNKTDKGNWFRFWICLKYLKGKIEFKLSLTEDELYVVKWWVYASYTIHDNCNGHTGTVMTLGKVSEKNSQ